MMVSVASNNDEYGTVSLTVDENDITGYSSEYEYSLEEGSYFTATATPKEHYHFAHWKDGTNMVTGYTASFTERAEHTHDYLSPYTAVFEKDSFNINVTVSGIDASLVEITGAGRYGYGDKAELTFKLKDEHYDFDNWYFDKNHFEDQETLVFENIDSDHEVRLAFKAKYYSVTATVTPEGAGVVKGQGNYEYGTEYTLTLEPAEGWELKEWRDGIALDEKSNELKGLVIGDVNIEVELVQNIVTYNVTFLDWDATVLFVEKVEEGKDAKGPDTNPEREGYTFIGWAPDITNVTSDRTVIAQYEKKDATGIDNVQRDNVQCTKVLRDGVLYIMYNGTMYNVQGQRVK